MSETLEYTVEGMFCGHCKAAVSEGLLAVARVVGVEVDLESKSVVATGTDLDDEALRAAIAEAGYEAS